MYAFPSAGFLILFIFDWCIIHNFVLIILKASMGVCEIKTFIWKLLKQK